MLDIVIDENIAFPEAFELFGRVRKVNGRAISNSILKDCDILIIRSVTAVNEELLHNTKIKFVGTATSGTDHLDINLLNEKKIFFADAKGCNSFAVAEYVIVAITKLLADSDEEFKNKKIGIVGYGNIGTKVAEMCKALGMNVKINDPPLKRIHKNFSSASLEEILECDIITLHIPLTFLGEDKTYNLLDENLSLIRDEAILINTSRGGVINEKTLLKILKHKKIKLVTDVWIDEPYINIELLNKSIISTPHIAGYSIEGKVNGSKMIFENLNNFLGTNYHFDFNDNSILNEEIKFEGEFNSKNLDYIFRKIYDIEKDSLDTKKMLEINQQERANYFDQMRKKYTHRKSFKNYTIKTSDNSRTKILEALRFQVQII